MSTLILQSTYRLLEKQLKDLDKKMEEVGIELLMQESLEI